MTIDEIDHLLDFMAAEAKEKGDDSLLPGMITCRWMLATGLPRGAAGCTNILHGIRYRGIQILVAGARK